MLFCVSNILWIPLPLLVSWLDIWQECTWRAVKETNYKFAFSKFDVNFDIGYAG